MSIVVDTDLANEVDDQFALAYILRKPSLYRELAAITLEPYDPFWQDYNRQSAMPRNILTAHRMLLLADQPSNLVYPGSELFTKDVDGDPNNIPAVKKIINLASRSKITILALGCLTNIALALICKPSIAANITLIWSGGRDQINHPDKVEFNLRQDIYAAQIVFKFIPDITMIYSKEISSAINLPLNQLISSLANSNKLSDYLLDVYASLQYVKEGNIKNLYDTAIPILLTLPNAYTISTININGIDDHGNYIIGKRTDSHVIRYCSSINRSAVINELLTTLS